MLADQDLTEGAPYDHPDHGRVQVVLVGDESVTYECTDRTLSNSRFHPMHTIPKRQFRDQVEPLPITLSLPAANAQADSTLGGV